MTRFVRIFRVDVLVRTSNILLLPVYLRLMTVEEFGLYGYLTSIVAAFALFLNLGLYVPQIKSYSDYEGRELGVFCFTLNATLLAFYLLICMVALLSKCDVAVVSLLIRQNINYGSVRYFVFLSLFTSMFGLMLYSFFMAAEEIVTIQKQNMLRLCVVHGLVISLLYVETGDRAIARLKYASLAEMLVFLVFFSSFVKAMVLRYDWAMARKALSLGLPIMGGGIINMIYSLSDRFFLERFHSLRAVAIYNVGLSIASIIIFASTSFQSVYAPLFFKEKNVALGFVRFKRVIKYALIGYVLCGVCLFIGTQLLLKTSVIKAEYSNVIYVLPLLLGASIATSVGQFYLNYTTYFEVTYIGLIVGTIASCANFSLNFLTVPSLGVYGAALSSLVSAIIALVCLRGYVVRRVRRSMLGKELLIGRAN